MLKMILDNNKHPPNECCYIFNANEEAKIEIS